MRVPHNGAMRVLIVEDDARLADAIARGLRQAGMAIDVALDGRAGLEKALVNRYEAVVLDRQLPAMHGDEVCRRLTRLDEPPRILMLTASGTLDDRVQGLTIGADDYLAKPFEMAVLLARLHALVRRAGGHAATLIRYGPVELDPSRQRVRVDGAAVELTAFEYRVLEYLAMKAGRVVSKAELVDQIYQQDFDRESNTIEVFVGRLRKKLDPGRRLDLIHTVRGQGYRFGQ